MAVAAKKNEYMYAPSRVYSYSRTATAAASEAEPLPDEESYHGKRQQSEPYELPAPAHKKTRVIRENPAAKRKHRLMPKIVSVMMVFIATAAIIGIMARYNTITTEYSHVNDLKNKIEASREDIAALNVKLNSGISIEKAKEAALKAGMSYPAADQIVRVDGADTSADNGVSPE